MDEYLDDMTVKREGSVITFDYYGVDIIFGDMWTVLWWLNDKSKRYTFTLLRGKTLLFLVFSGTLLHLSW